MKMNPYSGFLWLALILAVVSCNDNGDPNLTYVSVEHSISGNKLSDLLSIDGFTVLDNDAACRLRGAPRKVLFHNGQLAVLDNETDFKTILRFDERSGRFLGFVGRQSGASDGYEYPADIAPAPSGEGIRCLATDKKSFMDFDWNGNLNATIPNGMFGESLQTTPDGDCVVYNEYVATELTGRHHLLFFDKTGNLRGRAAPYLPAKEGMGFHFSGFLSASDRRLWFSPPFCDTVFEISEQRVVPRYVFDFGPATIPATLRAQKISGWDVDANTYLTENFVKVGPFAVFTLFADQRLQNGIFDERSGAFLNCREAENDCLYELLQLGEIFPKGDNAFALAIRPDRIRYLLDGRLDTAGLRQQNPQLLEALELYPPTEGNYLLLYLSFKPGAGL